MMNGTQQWNELMKLWNNLPVELQTKFLDTIMGGDYIDTDGDGDYVD